MQNDFMYVIYFISLEYLDHLYDKKFVFLFNCNSCTFNFKLSLWGFNFVILFFYFGQETFTNVGIKMIYVSYLVYKFENKKTAPW